MVRNTRSGEKQAALGYSVLCDPGAKRRLLCAPTYFPMPDLYSVMGLLGAVSDCVQSHAAPPTALTSI